MVWAHTVQHVTREAYGAAATTIPSNRVIVIGNECLHAIILSMTVLQDSTTASSLANLLTQFATTIIVKVGGTTVFQISATDLYRFLAKQKYIPFYIVPGVVDNEVYTVQLVIPFGRVFADNQSIWKFVDAKLGIKTKQQVTIELAVPADGNETDTRLLTIVAIVSDANPSGFITRINETVTAVSAGWGGRNFKDLIWGQGVWLYDIFMYQATSLKETTTTDTTTFEEIECVVGRREVLGRMNIECLLADSELSVDHDFYDDYIYVNFDKVIDQLSLPDVPRLDRAGRITWNAGDTGVARMMVGYVVPNF